MKSVLRSKKTVTVVLLSTVITAFLLISNSNHITSIKVEVSGNYVDNRYNNMICGTTDLLRIKNKLYYNYNKNNFQYGTFQISEAGTNRIQWDGFHFVGSDLLNNPIYSFDDELFMHYRNNEQSYKVGQYDSMSNNFHFDASFEIPPLQSYLFQETADGILYSNRGMEKGVEYYALCEWKNNESLVLINKDITSFYAVGDTTYYLLTYRTNKIEQTIPGANEYSREIRVFNRITHNDELLLTIDQYDFYSFIVSNHTIIFKGFSSLPIENDQYEYGILSINLNEKRIVPIMLDESINGFNVFQGVVYITTDDGIFSYNLENNVLQSLTKTGAKDCFILDDKWVYFTRKNCSLWRVSQTGGESVKVFG